MQKQGLENGRSLSNLMLDRRLFLQALGVTSLSGMLHLLAGCGEGDSLAHLYRREKLQLGKSIEAIVTQNLRKIFADFVQPGQAQTTIEPREVSRENLASFAAGFQYRSEQGWVADSTVAPIDVSMQSVTKENIEFIIETIAFGLSDKVSILHVAFKDQSGIEYQLYGVPVVGSAAPNLVNEPEVVLSSRTAMRWIIVVNNQIQTVSPDRLPEVLMHKPTAAELLAPTQTPQYILETVWGSIVQGSSWGSDGERLFVNYEPTHTVLPGFKLLDSTFDASRNALIWKVQASEPVEANYNQGERTVQEEVITDNAALKSTETAVATEFSQLNHNLNVAFALPPSITLIQADLALDTGKLDTVAQKFIFPITFPEVEDQGFKYQLRAIHGVVYLSITESTTNSQITYRVGDSDGFTAILCGKEQQLEISTASLASDGEIIKKLNNNITYGASIELCSYSIPLGATTMLARAELNRVLDAAIGTYQQQLQAGQVLELVVVSQTEQRVEKLLRITQTAASKSSQRSGQFKLHGTLFSPIPMLGFGSAQGSLDTSSATQYESNQGVTLEEFIHSLQHGSIYIAIKSE